MEPAARLQPARGRLPLLAALAMAAFAGNSILCRLALKQTDIDPASFTSIRLASGAIVLAGLAWLRAGSPAGSGTWLSAFALFAYAAGFSFAYTGLPTGTGALLLFGAVQTSMLGYGLVRGERLGISQSVGLLCALAGLVLLVLPGVAAPSVTSSALMIGAGIAWGIYSIRGRSAGDPAQATTGNFIRSVPFTLALSACLCRSASVDAAGAAFATLSGSLTSALGYILWYTTVKQLKVVHASIVQLSVPVLAALGGVALLGEQPTIRLFASAALVLGGIALVVTMGKRR